MRMIQVGVRVVAVSSLLALAAHAATVKGVGSSAGPQEVYTHEPMPPDFQVVYTELEGSLYTDASGRTLYTWPTEKLNKGQAGEMPGKPICTDEVIKGTASITGDIYRPGLLLPDLDSRRSCAQEWPAVFASNDAKPVGSWSVVTRPDGRKQWAYKGQALYLSRLDELPGDTRGATGAKSRRGNGRRLVGPAPVLPPQFDFAEMSSGRILTTYVGESLYTWEKDSSEKSSCFEDCLKEWSPVLAPNIARAPGEWSIFERAPGVKQWAFRKKPVYTHIADDKVRSFEGSDVPGWHNVYLQHAPAPPKEFTVQDTRAGQVLADSRGKTIYLYNCTEDTVDRSSCDYPDAPQMYRFAVCGGGDPDVCLKTFPYVIAAKNADSGNRTWAAMDINPKTGHRAAPSDPGTLHVWAYRGRPIYTFNGDKNPGDIEANSWGQGTGSVNGFKAFWLRDDFRENDA